jgi:uncharacterized protein (TIGR02996 family)
VDTEAGFLAHLQAEPAADATRLVYADWLEEQGDPVSVAKAEFLRVTVDLAAYGGDEKRSRLQVLAAALDTDWLAVVSCLPIENCHGKRTQADQEISRRYALRFFNYLCDRRWEDLKPTDDRAVRLCEGCKENVHYCDTIMQAREHAWAGHCVAIDLGVIRHDRDLEPQMAFLGRVTPDYFEEERQRLGPDPVSAERQRRKEAAQQTQPKRKKRGRRARGDGSAAGAP